MRKVLTVASLVVVGAVLGGVLWWWLNGMVQINNVGWLELMPWPLNSWVCWAIAGGILGGGLAVSYLLYWHRQTRQGEQVAATLGLEFTATVKPDALPGRASLPVLRRLSWAGNVMTGEYNGQSVAVVDCGCIEGDGDTRQWVDHTIVLLTDLGSNLPEFSLRPITRELSLLASLGMRSIQLDPDAVAEPEAQEAIRRFQKTYHLSRGLEKLAERMKAFNFTPPDDTAIHQAFPLEVVSYFADNPGWNVQASGGLLALWRGERWYPAHDRASLLDQSLEVCRTLTSATTPAAGSVVLPASPRTSSPFQGPARLVGALLGAFIGFSVGGALVMGALMGLVIPLAQGNNPLAFLLVPVVFFGGLFLSMIVGGFIGYLVAPLIRKRLESRWPQQPASPTAPDKPESKS